MLTFIVSKNIHKISCFFSSLKRCCTLLRPTIWTVGHLRHFV